MIGIPSALVNTFSDNFRITWVGKYTKFQTGKCFSPRNIKFILGQINNSLGESLIIVDSSGNIKVSRRNQNIYIISDSSNKFITGPEIIDTSRLAEIISEIKQPENEITLWEDLKEKLD